MWVRGLKLPQLVVTSTTAWSHPMWVRGLKQLLFECCYLLLQVAPHVGAWIETTK